jgi:hypothetical protein
MICLSKLGVLIIAVCVFLLFSAVKKFILIAG